MNLCQGGPGEDPGYGGRGSHPHREESREAPHSGGYPRHPAQDGLKGPGTPSGKLRSMHLAVPGAVAHIFHIQRAQNQGGVDWAWLSPAFL